ncbi:MAG TPA: hypothetical protein VJ021_08310 [Thermoplasmata archaeon]|nr:hypothetical protein [Thermoplasmata archaeon]
MPPIFKDGSATLDQGLDLARRREFDRAREKFLDASRKFSKEGSILYVSLANAYADLFSIGVRNSNPNSLLSLSALLRSGLGSTELRPGPRGISAADLASQLEVTAHDVNVMSALQSGAGSAEALGLAVQQVANEYARLGNQVLFLPELFNQQIVPADSRFPVLMALSFETLGNSLQASNPLGAAEHFQTAQQYWAQAGDESKAQTAANRVASLALQAKCWFCGREGTGHGIQFVSLPIGENVDGLKGAEASPLPSVDRSGRNVFACKGCYSAVWGLADRIAVQRAGEAEARLMAEIRAMEQRLQSHMSLNQNGRS